MTFAPTPEQLRDLLVRLGPIGVKLGQHLAVRPDLLAQEYCHALMDLTDRVPPFEWSIARSLIIEDLGDRAEELLESIDHVPVASGSLAQVHLARLRDGTRVAVKVQRPDLHATVERGLRRLRLLARAAQLARSSFVVSPTEAVDEVSDWIHQEIDFRRELANLRILYDLARTNGGERIPRPQPRLSGARVLTTEYLEGVVVSDLLRGGSDESGIDRQALAYNLLEVVLTQMFRYRFFHADVHPGNLVALGGDRLGFVDFGLCAELDETVRQRQLRYLSAVYEGDVNRMFDAATDVFVIHDRTDLESFRRDFFTETESWLARRRDPRWHGPETIGDGADARSPSARYLVGVMALARRHGLQVPVRILAMYRALLTAEAVSRRLSPDVDLTSVARRFFLQLQTDDVFRRLEPDRVQPLVADILTLLHESPAQVQQLLSELADGSFTLQVDMAETPRAKRAQDRRTRALVTAISTVSVAILLTGTLWLSGGPTPSAMALAALLAVLYLTVLVQGRRL